MTLATDDRLAVQEQRIVDAALRCIARWGVAKTTLDDVAREASCSRATVYRLFPGGKDAVLEATVRAEVARFYAGLAERLDGAGDDLEDLLVAGAVFTSREIAGNRALQFVLAHEPGMILPLIAFNRMDRVLRAVSEFAAPYLEPHVGAEEAPRLAEWVARIVLSYMLSPAEAVDVRDEDSVRRLVRTFVFPGLARHVRQ
jgi:AcrR family transcriptional regulator